MNLQGLENKKWDFNKQEELAISWLLKHGFEVKLKNSIHQRIFMR